MEATKKERAMTEKGWLQRANGKAGKSAEAFIKAHRQWLETGSLAQFTSPLLRKLDEGEVFPTPCLEVLKSVVLGHLLAKDQAKAETVIAKGSEPKDPKQYVATIYDASGRVCTRTTEDGKVVDLILESDDSGLLDRWVDRRLFEGSPDWFGVLVNTKMVDKNTGENFSRTILRDDAIARILRKPKGPASRQTAKTTSKLSWGMRVKGGGPAHFSRG